MQLLVHLWSPLFFLKLCSAQDIIEDIPCTCTQVGGDTQCSVPEFNVDGCEYQWTNGTRDVIADLVEPTEDQMRENSNQVKWKSNQTLVIRGCTPLSHYICICFTKGIKRMATCTFNCSTEVQPGKENERPNWVVPVSVSVVVVVVAPVLVALVIYGIISYKKKYAAVPKTERPDVEDQRL